MMSRLVVYLFFVGTSLWSASVSAEWFLRGTHNNWAPLQMTESADAFEATVRFDGGGGDAFKFDRWGDWRENYGDYDGDGRGDRNGFNIRLSEGAGQYRIIFRPHSKRYITVKLPEGFGEWNIRGTHNAWQNTPMERDGYVLKTTVTFGETDNERFKFDRYGDWSTNFGDSNRDGVFDWQGEDIAVTQGPGRYAIYLHEATGAYTVVKLSPNESDTDWQRTVIFVQANTQEGQNLFIRGGIDPSYAQNNLGRQCVSENENSLMECAIPIVHLNTQHQFTNSWREGDHFLDWSEHEITQTASALGTPMVWTSDNCAQANMVSQQDSLSSCNEGSDAAGVGYTALNQWGDHYWMLDVLMDCSATVDGWFEVRTFLAPNGGLEREISQGNAPWASPNHFARCGAVNVFRRGQDQPVAIEARDFKLEAYNRDRIPSDDWLALHRIDNLLADDPDTNWEAVEVHDTTSVRFRNHSGRLIRITNAEIRTGDPSYFVMPDVENQVLPIEIPPGAYYDFPVEFVAGFNADVQKALRQSLLILHTDSPTVPAMLFNLAGYNMLAPEGGNEPTVTDILKTMGYGTVVTHSGQSLQDADNGLAVGDEVISSYWERMDVTQPVEAQQIAAFHSCCYDRTLLAWHARGNDYWHHIMRHQRTDGQTLLPRRHSSDGLSEAQFEPSEIFGFIVDGHFSDPSFNNDLRKVRFWPLKNHQGNILPGRWIMVMDYTDHTGFGGNFDYNDNVYVISNIQPWVDPSVRPFIDSSTIENNARDVSVFTGISVHPVLPNVGGLDNASVTNATVKLLETATGSEVVANVNSTGGGDAITLQPVAPLKPQTRYTFNVTAGVKDAVGVTMSPFVLEFWTGDMPCCVGENSPARFDKIPLSLPGDRPYTAVAMGPDGRLYAATMEGEIIRFELSATGIPQETEVLHLLTSLSAEVQTITSLFFDPSSTAAYPVLWVSHGGFAAPNAGDWSGAVSRFSGANLQNLQRVVIGLPHSTRDHLTNASQIGPDGALYILQGSNTALGQTDGAWGNRPERLLSGALLRLDLNKVEVLPLDAKTSEGGGYDPYAADAPLRVYATGLRNAYDMVWHTNGELYVTVNGSAPGGNTPATPNILPRSCSRRIDQGEFGDYLGPAVPGIRNVRSNQHDFLARVVTSGYYGHPNPLRCEWVLNGGNPTVGNDPAEVPYPVGVAPDRNWRGWAFDFGHHKSANGIIEYRSEHFGGYLQGKLLVVRYSQNDDIIVLVPGGASNDIIDSEVFIPGFTGMNNPLDLIEDTRNGNLYVAELTGETELTGRITLLRPR